MANVVPFDKRHNMAVRLDLHARGAAYFRDVITTLQHSRLSFILQEDMDINVRWVEEFWNTARVDEMVNPNNNERRIVFQATVQGRELRFSNRRLRTIFHLGEREHDLGVFQLGPNFIQFHLQQMGYVGALPATQFLKSKVYGQWRYLFHVFVTVFKPTKTGHDTLDAQLLSMIICLTLNRPYPYSRWLFAQFSNNIQHPKNFLFYPRFVMIIIRHLLPELQYNGGLLVHGGVVDHKMFNLCLKHHPNRAGEVAPQVTPLYGLFVDPNFHENGDDPHEDVHEEPHEEEAPHEEAPHDQPVHEDDPHLLVAQIIQAAENQENVDPYEVDIVVNEILNPPVDVLQQVEDFHESPHSAHTEILDIHSSTVPLDLNEEIPDDATSIPHPQTGPSSSKRPRDDEDEDEDADQLLHRPRRRIDDTLTLSSLHAMLLHLHDEVARLKAEDERKSRRIKALEDELAKFVRTQGESCKEDELKNLRDDEGDQDEGGDKGKGKGVRDESIPLIWSDRPYVVRGESSSHQQQQGQQQQQQRQQDEDEDKGEDVSFPSQHEQGTTSQHNESSNDENIDMVYLPVPDEGFVVRDGVQKSVNFTILKDVGNLPIKSTRAQMTTWFREPQVEVQLKQKFYTRTGRTPKLGLISWMFDRELQLFCFKRFDGVQYMAKDKSKFNSFPKVELRDLARREIINRDKDPFAEYIQKLIRKETNANVFDELSPAKGKFVVNHDVIDEQTGKPESRIVYPPVDSVTKIPFKDFGRDILQDLYVWAVDTETGEAVMYRKDDEVEAGMTEILRVYDATQLANLTKLDLQVLNDHHIYAQGDWADIGRDYQRIVTGCLKLGVDCDSQLLHDED